MAYENKNPILQARELSKSFYYPEPLDIFKNVSLDLHLGQSIAIMGASGEGKSTLLHILGTLERPNEGNITIAGQPVTPSKAAFLRNLHIGFVFQAFNLLEDYSAIQNVLMPALIGQKPIHKGSSAHQRAQELLSLVGLDSRSHFMTKLLSGGEKQRVALARALCNDPEIILADEPTGNLDSETSEKVHHLLFDLTRKFHKALVIVTHDKELAKLCNQVFYLKKGKLEQQQ